MKKALEPGDPNYEFVETKRRKEDRALVREVNSLMDRNGFESSDLADFARRCRELRYLDLSESERAALDLFRLRLLGHDQP